MRKHRRSRTRLYYQYISRHQLQINLFVINAAELHQPGRKNELLARMDLFALENYQANPNGPKGCWLLIMIHTSEENQLAFSFSQILRGTNWCAGTHIVEERSNSEEGWATETARAIIELHKLHFPAISNPQRSQHILIFGGSRERHLYDQVQKAASQKNKEATTISRSKAQ